MIYDDYKRTLLLEVVAPEIREFYAWLIKREGPEQGRYIFDQVLSEMKSHMGVDKLAALLTVGQAGDYK